MTQINENQAITASLFKGINFHFKDGENKINVIGSMISGKETIYLNGTQVSKKRSMRMVSLHKFTHHEVSYEVELKVTDLIWGKMDCTLIENDTHFKTLKFTLARLGIKSVYVFLGFVVGMGLAGYFTGRYIAMVVG